MIFDNSGATAREPVRSRAVGKMGQRRHRGADVTRPPVGEKPQPRISPVSIFKVSCNSGKWQDDFEPVISNLYRLFTVILVRMGVFNDLDEIRHRAVLRSMHRFMRAWSPGTVVRIPCKWIALHALLGRDVLVRPQKWHKSVRAKACGSGSAVHAKPERLFDTLAWREMLERLDETDRGILEDWAAGYFLTEIRIRNRVAFKSVKKAMKRAVRLLQS
jgi:hypothetical protein